eukprot:CAMPEP_0171122820 /NCGR_PEP_ID=MMETSP0766_2-20121228/105860_1 /TAXON_ID=439317 /ORGANISM="Gambierdiscus australes, Strain CAWD 149" /LENGTH=178 /DNA_ID=CAMNT_0011585671 /DNA_START=33 /DNA_END=567 /DNA_ORIENTATION=+
MTAVLYMSPAAVLICVPFVLLLERYNIADFFRNVENAVSLVGLVLFPGFLAFLLLLVEVQLVKETSSLTLTVFGNLKSVVTILFSVLVFHERTSLLQWCGLVVALTGMLAYSHARGEWVASETFDKIKTLLKGREGTGGVINEALEEQRHLLPKEHQWQQEARGDCHPRGATTLTTAT